MDEVRHTTEPEVDLAPGREGAKLKRLSTCRDGKFQTRSSGATSSASPLCASARNSTSVFGLKTPVQR